MHTHSIAALAALAALVACTGGEDGAHYAEKPASSEDSGSDTAVIDDADDAAHAVLIDWETEMFDTLDGTDEDWFRVDGMAAGQQFRVQVVNDDENVSPESLDTVVEVYDSAQNVIAWEDEHPAGDVSTYDSVCFGFFPEAGSYYIRVLDRGAYTGVPNDVENTEYSVQLLAPWAPSAEPDSLLKIGLDVDMTTTNSWYAVPVRADDAGDVDYVKLSLAHADGALTFVAAQHIVSSAYSPAITLYEQGGDAVLRASSLSESDYRQYISPPGTTYVLGVEDTSGVSGPAHGMWIFIANSAAGYGNEREVEPNDAQGAPMALTLTDQEPDAGSWDAAFVEGRIGTPADADWYSFSLERDSYVAIAFGALTYGSLLAANIEVYGSELVRGGGGPLPKP